MRPKFYLFGDSITEMSFSDGGWGASLANHFSRTVDVMLRGYDGYNTRWALKSIEKVFPPAESGSGGAAEAPLAVTVFFGANDSCLPDGYGAFLHVPVDEYKQNLHSIVSFIKMYRYVITTSDNEVRLPEVMGYGSEGAPQALLSICNNSDNIVSEAPPLSLIESSCQQSGTE